MKNGIILLTWMGLLLSTFPFSVSPSGAEQLDSQVSLNVKDSSLKGVLELIAAKAGMELVLERDPNVNVTLAQNGVSARQVLDKLSRDQQIEYTISGNQLIVTKQTLGGGTVGEAHAIHLNYAAATDIYAKVVPVLDSNSKILVDDRTNSMFFIGSRRNFDKIQALVELFDSPPRQIMIEALIVETSHSFLQAVGISIGDTSDLTLTNDSHLTGYSTTAGPTNPNGSLKAIIGHIDGRALDVRLTAAESKGEAKVISRPKVSTLDNRVATVVSGVTYHVKTLSNVSAGGNSNATITGGVTAITAGLSLNLLPSIVGTDHIKMVVDINDSQPDEGTSVDGIPGIITNSANTAVIVKNKDTAVIAGLIKQSKSKNTTGVPFFSDIPILGLLFKSNSVNDINNELVIFLTPSIEDPKAANADHILAKTANKELDHLSASGRAVDFNIEYKAKTSEKIEEKTETRTAEENKGQENRRPASTSAPTSVP